MRTKEEQRRYQNEWVKRRRLEWIKENGPCVKCGTWSNLQVDHKVNLEKEIATRSLWSLSPKNPQRVKELAKCQVLCRKCHRGKTDSIDSLHRVRGDEHPRAKLTEPQVKEIRRLRAKNWTQRAIAHKFGVSRQAVEKICNRKTWVHI